MPAHVVYLERVFDVLDVKLYMPRASGGGASSGQSHTTDQVFRSSGRPLSINDLVNGALEQCHEIAVPLVPNDAALQRTLDLSFGEGSMEFQPDPSGPAVQVERLVASISIRLREYRVSAPDGAFFDYGAIQRAEYLLDGELNTIRFAVQHTEGDDTIRVAVERL
jgi:hypothetical protein